jgi:hypothetical protein
MLARKADCSALGMYQTVPAVAVQAAAVIHYLGEGNTQLELQSASTGQDPLLYLAQLVQGLTGWQLPDLCATLHVSNTQLATAPLTASGIYPDVYSTHSSAVSNQLTPLDRQ